MGKIVCLMSGGLDSTIGFEYIRRKYKTKVTPLYINLQTKYSKEERECLGKLEKLMGFELIVVEGIDLGQYEQGKNAFIYCRNLILACIAGNYGDRIVIFGIKGDSVSDKNKEIFKKMSSVISEAGGKKIEVISPFWSKTKSQLVSWFLKNYEDKERALKILQTSFSCYTPINGKSCGQCNCCLRRAISLEKNKVYNREWFVSDVREYGEITDYINKMKKGLYDRDRTKESLEVFKKWGWKI